MKLEYQKEQNFPNKCFEELMLAPERLLSFVDLCRWEDLPNDLTPWSSCGVERELVIEILQNHHLNPKLIDKLKNKDSLVVMVGQQPGLMGGPLFCLYKTLTAIRLAEKIEKERKVPVVPIFCNLSDDHDWGEANRLALWQEGQWIIQKLKEEPSGAHLFDKAYPDSWRALGQAMGVELRQLESAYYQFEPGSDWGSFMSRFINGLFEGSSLLVVEQRWFRSLQSTFLSRALNEHDTFEQCLMMAGSALQMHQQKPALTTGTGYQLCFEEAGRRERLIETPEGLGGRHSVLGTKDEVLRLLAEKPTKFSCNVVTRPIWMRQLFPVVAEIVGPGETAYQLQLQGIYKHLGIKAPVLVPRMSAVLLRAKETKRLEALGRKPWEIVGDFPLNQKNELKEAVEERLLGMKQLYSHMKTDISHEYPEINDKITKAEQRLARDLDRIPDMLTRAEAAQQGEAVNQWEALKKWIFPLGKPQERVLSLASISLLEEEKWWTSFRDEVDCLRRETVWVSLDR